MRHSAPAIPSSRRWLWTGANNLLEDERTKRGRGSLVKNGEEKRPWLVFSTQAAPASPSSFPHAPDRQAAWGEEMKSPRTAGAAPVRLPRSLRPLFWDHDFAPLDLGGRRRPDHRPYPRGRGLGGGPVAAPACREPALQDWLQRRHGAGLSARQLRFWEIALGLPRRQVNAWLTDPGRSYGRGGATDDLASRDPGDPATARTGPTRPLADAARLLPGRWHGVALHLGHRRSVDLDWFTAEGYRTRSAWPRIFASGALASSRDRCAGNAVRHCPRCSPGLAGIPLPASRCLAPVAAGRQPHCRARRSRRDETCRRGTARRKKDFVDVYALGSRSCSLRQMLRW